VPWLLTVSFSCSQQVIITFPQREENYPRILLTFFFTHPKIQDRDLKYTFLHCKYFYKNISTCIFKRNKSTFKEASSSPPRKLILSLLGKGILVLKFLIKKTHFPGG